MGIPPILPINISTVPGIPQQKEQLGGLPVEQVQQLKEFSSAMRTERQHIDTQGQGLELEGINREREKNLGKG